MLKIASTGLLKKFSQNIQLSETEFYLQMPLGQSLLVAKIDLLIKDEEGNYEIWDWKSNKIPNSQYYEKLVKDYELQMKVYCYFISLLYPGQNQFKARLLFTRLANENASDEEWTKVYLWDRNEVKEFEKEINAQINKIGTLYN